MNEISNVSFGAKVKFADTAKCLSGKQKSHLKTIAYNIGNNNDYFIITTRKQEMPIALSDEKFIIKDAKITSSLNSKTAHIAHDSIQTSVEKENGIFLSELPNKERWQLFHDKLFEEMKAYFNKFANTENLPQNNTEKLNFIQKFKKIFA